MKSVQRQDVTTEQNYTLVHAADQTVDVELAVAGVTAFDEVSELALSKAAVGAGQLEGPEELVGLLEVGTGGVDLVHEVLDGDDAELAELLLDDGIVAQRDALTVNLGVTTLVDELTDSLQVGLAVGDVGLDQLQHLLSGLC